MAFRKSLLTSVLLLVQINSSCDSESNKSQTSSDNATAISAFDAIKGFNLATNEDTTIEIPLLSNAKTPAGLALSPSEAIVEVEVLKVPLHGELKLKDGAQYTAEYIPAKDYEGRDQASIFVRTRSSNKSKIVNLQIDVKPVNDKPLVLPAAINLAKAGDTIDYIIHAVDPDRSDKLTFEIVDMPANGSASIKDQSLAIVTYTHNSGNALTDKFTVKVSDNSGAYSLSTVSVNVGRANTPPKSLAASVELGEDSKKLIKLGAIDDDSAYLAFSITKQPEHGSIELIDAGQGTLYFTPDADYNGADSIKFKVSDGISNSTEATISLQILAVNDTPRLADQTVVELEEDIQSSFEIAMVDPEKDLISIQSVSMSGVGSVSLDAGKKFNFSPTQNLFGSGFLSISVTDYQSFPVTLKVPFIVKPKNDAPVTLPQTINTDEDQPVEVVLLASDVDGDPLTFKIKGSPAKGTVVVSNNEEKKIRYTPITDANGIDTFEYEVSDGSITSTGTVSVNLNSVNDKPTVESISFSVPEDVSRYSIIKVIDPDNTNHSLSVSQQPSHGTVTIVGLEVTYKPSDNYFGADRFLLIASDGQISSDPMTVDVTVNPVDDAPTLNPNCELIVTEDDPTTLAIAVEDIESDPTELELYYPNGVYGNFSLNQPKTSVIFTPTVRDYYSKPNDPSQYVRIRAVEKNPGKDRDGNQLTYLESNLVSCKVTITNVQDPPVAHAGIAHVKVGFPKYFGVSATDPDGDPLSYEIVTHPTKMKASFPDNKISRLLIEASDASVMDDTLYFRVSDGKAWSNTVDISIVSSVNNKPTVQSFAVAATEDNPLDINLANKLYDADGDPLSPCEITANPSNGTLSMIGISTPCNLRYTPKLDFNGTDQFSYRTSDGNAYSDAGIVTINVAPVNDLPIATSSVLRFAGNTVIEVQLQASDIEGDTLTPTITQVSGACTFRSRNGMVALFNTASGNYCYFDYFVTDSGGAKSNLASIELYDPAVTNHVPIAFSRNISTAGKNTYSNATHTFSFPAKDPEGQPLTLNQVTGNCSRLSGCTMSSCTILQYTGANDYIACTLNFNVRDYTGKISNTAILNFGR